MNEITIHGNVTADLTLSFGRSGAGVAFTSFSVAVNRAPCDAGVRSHEDLNKFANRFEERGQPTIYGIEPGNDGNQVVLDMIATDTRLAGRLDTTWIDHTERSTDPPSDHAALIADFHLVDRR